MKYFPLAINLQSQPVLVVGGGQIACKKIDSLLQANAKITVIAPALCEKLQGYVDKGELVWHEALFTDDSRTNQQLKQFILIVVATSCQSTNKIITKQAHSAGVLVNSAYKHDAGNVILPAIISRGDVVVTVSSNGQSPVITRYLKQQLEVFIPQNIDSLSRWAQSWRNTIKDKFSNSVDRQQFWGFLLSGKIKDWVLSGKFEQADSQIKQYLNKSDPITGQVFLVGSGPGDPDLLTIKALKLIQQAEVVLYDRLVSDAIMDLVPDYCERIYVGKKRSNHALPQDNINQLLVDLAKQGKRVLRLKGGDPFIFGRGGEELELLAENNISFQVVPGITAASGCSSYAGIPLTHRDYSQSVHFIAGHLKDESNTLNWPELVNPNQTLVFYMGLSQLGYITAQLISSGLAPTTPVAIIEKGTTEHQRTVISTLKDIAALAVSKNLKAPTLIIVGKVVLLQEKLAWYS